MKYFPLFALFNISFMFCHAQDFTAGRKTQLRILTDYKEYEFISEGMEARLNPVMVRFEFIIPISSLKSLKDSGDLEFLQSCLKGNDIFIDASLPDDTSPDLDLSYFKGNKSIDLQGEINIGTAVFKSDLDFNGILINGGQGLVFNYNIFLNERGLAFMKVGAEKILEIEITAKGDKISGLTTVK